MIKDLDNHLNLKKTILFSIVACFLILIMMEWSSRVFVSWKNYNTKIAQYKTDNFYIMYHQMMKRDSDIGYFFYTEKPITLDRIEFKNEYYFVDLGVDSLFFRDDGINFERKKKLLAVGDSFVWGLGVELNQIFTDVMEEMDKDLKVINGGMPGFGPAQYTRVMKRFVKNHVDFDGVLYCFFSGNDVSYEYKFREWAEKVKRFPTLAPPSEMRWDFVSYKAIEYQLSKRIDGSNTGIEKSYRGFIKDFVKDWFAVFQLPGQLYNLFRDKSDIKSSNEKWYVFSENPTVKATNGEKIKLNTEYINEAAGETLSQSRLDYETIHQLNFPLAIESIVEAKHICDSLNKTFYLVYVPSKEEIYADALCSILEEPSRTQVRKKMNHLHQAILNACKSRNIKVIDLYDEFIRRGKQGDQLYYSIDSHFNKKGHKLAAEIILAYIANEK